MLYIGGSGVGAPAHAPTTVRPTRKFKRGNLGEWNETINKSLQ